MRIHNLFSQLGLMAVLASFPLNAAFGCGKHEAKNSPSTSEVSATENPTVVKIESRGYKIAVKSGEQGPLYTIESAQGKTLATNQSAKQLQATAPELYSLVKSAVASSESQLNANLQ